MNSNCNSNLENPSSELFGSVFQSLPDSQHEVVKILFSLMLHHSSGGGLQDGRKALMKEVETQTESTELTLNPSESLNDNKKKRRRRRKRRNNKNANDNETSTEVDQNLEQSVKVSMKCTNADIQNISQNNNTHNRTDVSNVENRSKSYRSELLGKLYRNRYSRSSSSSSRSSSVSVSRSRSRSRRSSPSFHEARRITSARRLPISYCRRSPRRGRERKRRRRSSTTDSSRSRSRSSGGRESRKTGGKKIK